MQNNSSDNSLSDNSGNTSNKIANSKKSIRQSFLKYQVHLFTAVAAMGYGFILTLFKELEENFGFNKIELGIIGAAGFLSGFLVQIWFARYADKGYASLMVRIGMIASCASAFWMIFATQFWQFFLARLFLGMAAALITPAVRRVIIMRSGGNVGGNLGKLASFELGGFAGGPAIAALFADRLGVRAPFILLSAVYAVFFLASLALRLNVETDSPETSTKRAVRELIKMPRVRAGVFMTVALFATIGAFEVTWSLYLGEAGAPTWLTGVAITLFAVPMVFLSPLAGRLSEKISPIKLMTVSVLGAMLCTAIYGFTPWLFILLPLPIIHGIFDAVTYTSTQVTVTTSAPKQYAGSAQGLLSGVGLLVAGIIAIVGGIVYEWAGIKAVYLGTAAIMVLMVLLSQHANRSADRLETLELSKN